MTISSTISKQSFPCNGILTAFDFSFPANSADDIKALICAATGIETELIVTTDYSVTLNDDGSGGTLTTVATWADGNTLVVYRETLCTQETEYNNNNFLNQEILESDLDKVMMILQELDTRMGDLEESDLDEAVIAAQAAQAAAELAEAYAETAQGLAEIAKTAAETAEYLAEIAQGGAETAEDNALAVLASAVKKTDYDAYSILAADTVDTPAALTLAASQIPGRKATGGIVALAKADLQTIINVEDGADVTDAINVGTSIHGATAKDPPIDADEVPLIDTAASNVLKKSTWTVIKAFLKTYFDTLYTDLTYPGWILIPAANYTTTPASTSTITMGTDMTSTVLVGMGLRYTISSVEYFGMVSAIASNLLTVAGAPLGGAVTNLRYGGRVHELVIAINGPYEDAANTALILSDGGYQLTWYKRKSYAVAYKFYSKVHDSHTTHGKATFLINSTELNTSTDGLTIAADATWYNTVVDIATAAYDINPGEPIEISVTKGGTGDATDLTGVLIIVEP